MTHDEKTWTLKDPRWAALQTRDPAAGDRFVYAVRTTGIYCRPDCPSRLAKPEHVEFHDTADEAEQAGYRPCKRCRPNEPRAVPERTRIVIDLCRYIECAESSPSLAQLARRAGWSPYHLQRTFKAVTGVTPKGYAEAHRTRRVQDGLKAGATVTDTLYDAGFNSNGRFYDQSTRMLGMTPSQYRAGGSDTDIRFAVGECDLGAILVAQSDKGVCAILIGDDAEILVQELQDQFPAANLLAGDGGYEDLVARVVGFIEAPHTGLDLPLDIRGTAFQRRVWEALQKIPAGQTLSYSEVAQRIGSPQAVRAVARACAANRLAVAIPCHRVVRTDGGVSGYRWGVDRKRALLQREANDRPIPSI
ncbi:bifunctional DNA-binding transcriptional regulator/O6-methylguanine-DNA methyltransferase Ada [Marinobacter nanhaiticus D15-8W]|uniref:Bifunctional DNA-binding transcriptional regulator/O6-methylguanine-DNA methyltransferase Ada n=1 Tax=Marinobacter nanhaiticus D15-8W TaxID=626887 RepID=N6VZ60_9GAMM|nr:bifunctional DNA-binding transcriptional regulator/O6-methylguanine-DNA methyltransferase Ada [Marinobacter nanhaiticus]ENO15570.1 bifunctional DNA-binding transcriptional regulator/O6-methylguanine-DNA methyltransferase Ada [Marinobacter nanhaiticus D15-8W]